MFASTFLILWAVTVFMLDFRFTVPGMDDWCYFAPAAAAEHPLAIKTPLVGDFLGGDHAWCLHWPGAPLIESMLLPFLQWLSISAARIATMILFQAIAAILTYRLARHYTGSDWIGIAAALLILVDRIFLTNAALGRCEPLTSIALLVLLLQFKGREMRAQSACSRSIAAVCIFLLPVLHPMTVVVGAAVSVYIAVKGRIRGANWVTSMTLPLAYFGGVTCLASWFFFQPEAWPQFRDHAAAGHNLMRLGGGLVPYFFGETPFLRYTPIFLYGPAIYFSAAILLAFRAGKRKELQMSGESADWPLLVVVLSSALIASLVFPNVVYLALVLPIATVLAAGGLMRAMKKVALPIEPAVCWMLFILAGYHGLTLVTRLQKFIGAGYPNLRAEIHQIFSNLPDAQTILVPDILWEEAIRKAGHYYLATLSQNSSRAMRAAYEDHAFTQVQTGDLLITNRMNYNSILTPVDPKSWEEIAHYKHIFRQHTEWGYEIKIYRRH